MTGCLSGIVAWNTYLLPSVFSFTNLRAKQRPDAAGTGSGPDLNPTIVPLHFILSSLSGFEKLNGIVERESECGFVKPADHARI